MFHDVDASLREFLRRAAVHDVAGGVVFDAPTPQWRDALRGPAVNIYLHNVSEDVERRGGDWDDLRNERGIIVGRRPPIRYYRLSYVVTAWARQAEEEHRLLARLLGCFASHEAIPEECLAGSLRDGAALPFSIALPQAEERQMWGLWPALGLPLKPGLDLVVVAPLEPVVGTATGPPVQERRISVTQPEGTPETLDTTAADAAMRERRRGSKDLVGNVVRTRKHSDSAR